MARSSFIIVVGASAGGLNAIGELVSQFPSDLNAAVFVVLHLSKAALGDIFVTRIQKNCSLPCKIAEDKEPIKNGHVYVALPDAHLLVKEDKIIIGHGPAENRFRPSIDVLFRSAAASHTEKVIGVILTGFLNDGTHYRCHIGHSFSESDLVLRQSEATEHTLWVAVRMMEERKLLLDKIARENREKGLEKLGAYYRDQSKNLDRHVTELKELLFAVNKN